MSTELSLIKALEQRVGILEQEYADLTESLSADVEEEFMDERQRWIDNCHERAAEKRRMS